MSFVDDEPELKDDAGRFGFSTFRSFTMVRDELRQILACALNGPVNGRIIREMTTLGTIHIESAYRFCRALDLVRPDGALTGFGRMAAAHDQQLDDTSTQWLLHYNIAKPHTGGPLFWPELFRLMTRVSRASREDMSSRLAEISQPGPLPGERTLKYAVTAFTGSYTRSDCLGHLRIVVQDDDTFMLGDALQPSMWVVAYVVADYWHAHWGDRATVNLSAMTEPGGPASLLLLSSGDMNALLREMQNQELVQIQRRVPPYQVVRLWDNPESILEHIYDSANA